MRVIEIGFGCNNACVHCAQGDLRAKLPFHARSELSARIAEIASGEPIAFVGGEPTLLDTLPELIREARQLGAAEVLIQTNARRLAAPGYAEELASAGATALDVSLFGSTEEMHDWHSGASGSFRQTIAGLRRARAARLPFATTTLVTRSNFRHLAEIVRLAHVLGARAVQLAKTVAVGRAGRNAPMLVAAPELVRPHVVRAIRLAQSLGLESRAGEVVSRPHVTGWFAGLGEIEVDGAALETALPVAGARRSLPVASLSYVNPP